MFTNINDNPQLYTFNAWLWLLLLRLTNNASFFVPEQSDDSSVTGYGILCSFPASVSCTFRLLWSETKKRVSLLDRYFPSRNLRNVHRPKQTHTHCWTKPFERYQPGKTNNCGSQSRPIGGNESDSSCKVSPSLHNLPARNSKQKVHPQCQRGTTDRRNRRSWTLLTNWKLGRAMRTVADFCYHFSVIQDHCRITEQEAAIVPPVVGTCFTRSRLSDESQNVLIVRERQEISFFLK